jgi:glycolate oxidase FAD binding subunit
VDLTYPERVGEVADLVRGAASAGRRMRIVGGRRHIARAGATEADAELWTTSLDGIVAYDPAEMIVVVRAGTRLGALRAALAEAGQEWPSDEPGNATVGGVIAAGVDPIRRLRTGLLRDTVVEMEAVLGDGRVVTSGARVVKNVSGFDVHRLLTGSLGTLGVITQVALKVRPLPKAAVTLVTSEGGLELGARLLDALWQPAAVLAEPDRVCVRLEGWPAEVAEQAATVRALTACDETDEPLLPGVDLFPGAPVVLEVGVVPSKLPEALAGVDTFRASLGVGLAWVPVPPAGDMSTRVDTVVECRAERASPPRPRSELEDRIRSALDPETVFAGT